MADSITPNVPVYPPQGIQAELNLIYLYNPDIALGYVTHDGSLSGTGLPTDPLKIVNAIPSGATVGQILGFGTNGIEWTTPDYYTTSQIDTIVSNLQTTISQTYLSKTDAASIYATQDDLEAVEAKLSAVYRFRGSVATYNDLPTTDNSVGDVWNVEDTGANYAWTGTAWDKLSETIDLTPYLTKEDAAATYATQEALTAGLNSKQDSLPAQTGNAGKFLKTDGDSLTWARAVENFSTKQNNLFIGNQVTGDESQSGQIIICPDGVLCSAKWSHTITIGTYAKNNGYDGSICIGKYSSITPESGLGDISIAIGESAKIVANQAIQLGSGTNTNSSTFQVTTYTLLDLNTGLIPSDRLASGGTVGQVLTKTDTGCEWGDLDVYSKEETDQKIQNAIGTIETALAEV